MLCQREVTGRYEYIRMLKDSRTGEPAFSGSQKFRRLTPTLLHHQGNH
jgi:hypothetical protein